MLERVQASAVPLYGSEPSFEEVVLKLDQYIDEQAERAHDRIEIRGRRESALASSLDGLRRARAEIQDEILLGRSNGVETEDLELVGDGISSLTGVLLQVVEADTMDEVEQVGSRLRVEARGFVPAVARLNRELSKACAELLLELQDNSSGAPRLVALSRDLLESRQQSESAKQQFALTIARLDALANKLRSTSGAASEALSKGLEAGEVRTHAIMAGLLVFLAASLLAAAYYTETRVTSRLRRMLSELTAISRGELNQQITLGGDVEIAEIARVADVLRENSLRLSETMELAEARSRELGEFAYVASHDLKSPLRNVITLASFVQEDGVDLLPEESLRHLTMLIERAHKMERMLEDLLRYSRIGHEHYPYEVVSIAELVRDVASLVESGSRLSVDVTSPESRVALQRPPIELALRNLLSNSVKHSDLDRTSVSVSCELVEPGVLCIDVEDDGPGLASQYAGKVFQLFERVNTSAGGTGMGLALVRRAAESIGGSAELMPREGRGFHVRLRWPVRMGTPTEGPRTAPSSPGSTAQTSPSEA